MNKMIVLSYEEFDNLKPRSYILKIDKSEN